jgi:hypothetical protein
LKRTAAVLLIFGVLVFLAYHFRSAAPPVTTEIAAKEARPLTRFSPWVESVASPDPSGDTPAIHAPTLEQVRKEASQDPHRTPPALLEFATRVGRKMDLAKKDPREAQDLYQEMENCARRDGPETLRVFCLSDARELSRIYPERLAKRFEQLRGSLPAPIVSLEDSF